MTFRMARQGEEALLARLRFEFLGAVSPDALPVEFDGFRQETEAYFKESLANESCRCVLAEEGDEMIGTGIVFFYRSVPSFSNPEGKNAYLTSLFVKPKWRRQGIATRIITILSEEAKKESCRNIVLHPSEEGKALYNACGFELCEPLMKLIL